MFREASIVQLHLSFVKFQTYNTSALSRGHPSMWMVKCHWFYSELPTTPSIIKPSMSKPYHALHSVKCIQLSVHLPINYTDFYNQWIYRHLQINEFGGGGGQGRKSKIFQILTITKRSITMPFWNHYCPMHEYVVT